MRKFLIILAGSVYSCGHSSVYLLSLTRNLFSILKMKTRHSLNWGYFLGLKFSLDFKFAYTKMIFRMSWLKPISRIQCWAYW